MSDAPSDPAAVHRRLLAIAREQRADFNAILILYAIERLLHRLSRSVESKRFVLKGAMLFRVWEGELHRTTKDVDFLGYGDPTPTAVAASMRRIIGAEVEEDGLRFDAESLKAQEIRAAQSYGGVNVTVRAYLGTTPIVVRVDVGFGDAVTPGTVLRPLPTLLGHEPPQLHVYPPETVIAEKVEAICTLGLVNSRMKDFYDLLVIARRFTLEGQAVTDALRATFERRATALPTGVPTGLSDEFANDTDKRRQWAAFLKRLRIDDAPESLADAVAEIWAFVGAPLASALTTDDLPSQWTPISGWNSATSN